MVEIPKPETEKPESDVEKVLTQLGLANAESKLLHAETNVDPSKVKVKIGIQYAGGSSYG